MPYIPEVDRDKFDEVFDFLWSKIDTHGISNGELNYIITGICLLYIDKHKLSYNTGSDIIKALECAKLEFYRRTMAPYEDSKLRQNGDVYPF